MPVHHSSAPWRERLKYQFGHMLVPSAQEIYAHLDWDSAAQACCDPSVSLPAYYLVPHHGLPSGYLSGCQAFSWELIENIFGIRRVRPALLTIARATLAGTSSPDPCILDLGCGTAQTSIALARTLPSAKLLLLDLSPYQLAAAECQIAHANLRARTQLLHASADQTCLPPASVDLALASLLFHELPRPVARSVVQEARRVLAPGGHLLVFDAIQQVVSSPRADQAINSVLALLMREVYWREYMRQPLWQLCQEEQFAHVERKILFALPWIYQVVCATR